MNTRVESRLIIATLLLSHLIRPCFGEADDFGSTERSVEALKINTSAAQSYRFELADEPRRELVFQPASLLRWSNPLAGEVYGDVFVWTHQGRPEVIGSMHQWYSPFTHGSHEFHSLATGPIVGKRDGVPVWTSEQPGVQFRRVPDQQTVGASPVLRLTQMRAISRQFTGQKTDREDVSRELRLLPQPIYRYSSDNSRVLDGALFVFVQGTDPEILLLVEARRVAEQWEWQYGLARLNSVQFVTMYQNREAWRVETTPANLLDGALFSMVNGTDPEVLLAIEARRSADGFQWQYAVARLCTGELQVTYDGQAVWKAALLQGPYTKLREPYTIIRQEFDAFE